MFGRSLTPILSEGGGTRTARGNQRWHDVYVTSRPHKPDAIIGSQSRWPQPCSVLHRKTLRSWKPAGRWGKVGTRRGGEQELSSFHSFRWRELPPPNAKWRALQWRGCRAPQFLPGPLSGSGGEAKAWGGGPYCGPASWNGAGASLQRLTALTGPH